MATGTVTYNAYDQYTHWTRRMRSTGGMMIHAEERGAHWLVDAIASYQSAKLDASSGGFQIWTLTREAGHYPNRVPNGAVLECWRDIPRAGVKGETPLVRQYIEYTDYPLVCGEFPGAARFYVEGEGTDRVLMLPDER